MDLLQKCFDYKDADNIKKRGFYPYFRPIESAQDTEVYIHNKKIGKKLNII